MPDKVWWRVMIPLPTPTSLSPLWHTPDLLPSPTIQQTHTLQGLVEYLTVIAPEGGRISGEREQLDDCNFFESLMSRETDVLVADAGMCGMSTRHPPAQLPSSHHQRQQGVGEGK